MTRTEQAIKNAYAMPRKAGRADYIRHLKGESLTRAEAIKARCYECVRGGDTQPCKSTTCSLTPYCQWNDVNE